jgi:hypothetical protein
MADVKIYEVQFEEKWFGPREESTRVTKSESKVSFFKRIMKFVNQENQVISIDTEKSHVYSTFYPSVGLNINH